MNWRGNRFVGDTLPETWKWRAPLEVLEIPNLETSILGGRSPVSFRECNTNHYRSMIHHFWGELNALWSTCTEHVHLILLWDVGGTNLINPNIENIWGVPYHLQRSRLEEQVEASQSVIHCNHPAIFFGDGRVVSCKKVCFGYDFGWKTCSYCRILYMCDLWHCVVMYSWWD